MAAALAALLGACRPVSLDFTEITDARLRAGVPVVSSPARQPAGRHELGRKVYNFRCYYCHGYSGNAQTLAASFVEPRPRNFADTSPAALSREAMIEAVRNGRRGTAMKPFDSVLSAEEIEAVVDFVRREFMERKRINTRYHIAANGWPQHERYRAAFPFATGQIALDTAWEDLTPEQAAGKRLFLASCITCHDRARVTDDGPEWEPRALSYPRAGFQYGVTPPPTDATTSATPYSLHDIPPRLTGLTEQEKQGERLFQANCAFCHAADGTGKNWIGTFMEPHPRNLTDPSFMSGMTRSRFRQVIRDGLPNTSMPAWKSVLEPGEIEAVIAYVSRAFHPVKD